MPIFTVDSSSDDAGPSDVDDDGSPKDRLDRSISSPGDAYMSESTICPFWTLHTRIVLTTFPYSSKSISPDAPT